MEMRDEADSDTEIQPFETHSKQYAKRKGVLSPIETLVSLGRYENHNNPACSL